jgi:hypothetical protein
VLADGGGPVHRSHALDQQASYKEALNRSGPDAGTDERTRAEAWRLRREAEYANLRGDKAAADELESRACDLEATLQHPSPVEQARMDAWPRARAANAWLEGKGPRPAWLDEPQQASVDTHNPAGAPAPAVTGQNGEQPMTTPATPTGRTRLPAQVKANAPAGWKSLATTASDFEPGTDEELLDWMASEVAGISTYSEALTDVYETCVESIRLDPVAMAALHDAADAAADFATALAYARQRFAAHYGEVRQFVGAGGVLPKDGDFITGEGDD